MNQWLVRGWISLWDSLDEFQGELRTAAVTGADYGFDTGPGGYLVGQPPEQDTPQVYSTASLEVWVHHHQKKSPPGKMCLDRSLD
jgi:hypothetical protein